MERERLTQTAQAEIETHLAEAQRLHDAADRLVECAEFHMNQVTRWRDYIGGLAVGEEVEQPTPRHLWVVR